MRGTSDAGKMGKKVRRRTAKHRHAYHRDPAGFVSQDCGLNAFHDVAMRYRVQSELVQ